MKQTWFTTSLLAVTLLLSGTFPVQAAPKQISIATNPVGMALYLTGASLSEVVKKDFPDVLQLNVEATKGGLDNANLLVKREVEIGFTSSDIASELFTGTGRYKGRQTTVLGMFAPLVGMAQLPVLKSAQIANATELKGKRIGLSNPSAMIRPITDAYLESEGLSRSDFKNFNEGLSSLVEKMKNGQIDGTLWFGVSPLAALMDLAKSRDVVWLPSDAKKVEHILAKYPWMFMTELPAGTYSNQDKPVPAIAERYIMVALDDTPDDVVYAIVKSAFENLPQLTKAYSGWRTCSKETALQGIQVPLHPGAVRYYREIKLPGLDEHLAKYPYHKK